MKQLLTLRNASKSYGNCSKGTIQKIAIMQALLSKPDLIILDESFSGLDHNSQDNLIYIFNPPFIKKYKKEGLFLTYGTFYSY